MQGPLEGLIGAEHCKPSPSFMVKGLDARIENWFLAQCGKGMIMETVYDAGDGTPERIAEVEAARRRLRDDREAGLYDAPDDAAWFRDRYAEMGRELSMLRRLPVRSPRMVTRPTGETIEDKWRKAPDDLARKEILKDFGVRVTRWLFSAPRRWHAGILHGSHLERII
ncbi:hypothetical protein [Streptomyces sp. NPDC049906]|uniref:hypothetical protein n=1 Tax=Streptomyces sp. NPDC049906 TaxID=3155656 RepID=UPI00343615AB